MARERYQGGLSPYVSVLTAENALIDERRAYADAQSRAFSLDITLIRALGGGYAARLKPVPGAPRHGRSHHHRRPRPTPAPRPLRPPGARARPRLTRRQPPPRRPPAAARLAGRPRRLFLILGAVVVLAAVGYGVYWLLVGSHHVSTDDAYVNADVADVTPLVCGPIVSAPATDTLPVKKGDVLVVIDPTDFKIALAAAEAALGQAQRKVEGYFANRDAQTRDDRRQGAPTSTTPAPSSPAPRPTSPRRAPTSRAARRSPHDGAVSGDELTIAENRLRQTEAAVGRPRGPPWPRPRPTGSPPPARRASPRRWWPAPTSAPTRRSPPPRPRSTRRSSTWSAP